MDTVVFVLQILMWFLCPAMIGLILLQGAAGDISSAFGGGGQLDASLGVGAHRKMAQVTGVLAVVFFVIVLILAYPHRKSFRDMQNAAKPTTPAATAPATPAPALPASAPVLTPAPAAPAVETPAAPAPTAEAQPAPAPAAEAQPAPAPAPAAEAQPAPAPAPAAEAQPAPTTEAAPAQPSPAAPAPGEAPKP